ncbi:hypothetical protein [Nocardia mangyaensis]|uniref:hypothetical protein n=1 Tax=Nocardia mangyaensis TaxID=2213200 RepID=UPI002675011C|nr:hypothetical protein [Nocardia mangyaensis]MDO3645383.1 hypothetical protein [Nocardia mangyaensis]
MVAQHSPRASRVRFAVTILLLTLTGVLVLGTVAARYVRSELLDTERYVETVAPLATDPTIQDAITDRVTVAILAQLDVEGMATDLAGTLAEDRAGDDTPPRVRAALRSLPALLTAQTENLVREATESVVRSEQFARLWTTANRAAHTTVAGALTGSGPLEVDAEGTVRVPLDQVAAEVRTRLHDRGFTVVDESPTPRVDFVVFEDPRIAQAQRLTRLLDRAGELLPLAALLTAIAAITIAPATRRRQAIALLGAVLIGAMTTLALALAFGRQRYLHEVPLEPAVARILFDTLTDPLRVGLRAVAVLGVVLTVGAVLAGPSRFAQAVRSGAETALGGRGPDSPGPVSRFLARNTGPLRWCVVLIAGLVLVFWTSPTPAVVAAVAAVSGVVILGISVLGRPVRDG